MTSEETKYIEQLRRENADLRGQLGDARVVARPDALEWLCREVASIGYPNMAAEARGMADGASQVLDLSNVRRLLNEAAIHFESFPGGRDGNGMALLYRAIRELTTSTGCGVESRHAGPGNRGSGAPRSGERSAGERYAVPEAGVATSHPTINAGGAISKSGDREVADQPGETSGAAGTCTNYPSGHFLNTAPEADLAFGDFSRAEPKMENLTRWRHVKRGTVYEEIGLAQLQTEFALSDGAAMIVYRGEDGRLWVRASDEFKDGRFARIEESKVPRHDPQTQMGDAEFEDSAGSDGADHD